MKMVIANWKTAPDTILQATTLAKTTSNIARTYKKNITLVTCVPSIHLMAVAKSAKTLLLGGQSVAPTDTIASTGLIHAAMLKSYGATYCIVGHSESRARGESDEIVKGQLDRLMEKKITPILCVGEKERDVQGWYLSVVKEQLDRALNDIPKASVKRIVIAYEPVWAIGAQAVREATAQECVEMIIFIRKIIADLYDEKVATQVTVLYGGSVSEENAQSFIEEGKADGLLVGRVSLDAKRFTKLLQSISH